MKEEFVRTALLLGEDNMQKLARANVLVFGVGGVGGYVCEALARSGVGKIGLVDHDVVARSNLNRQIIATQDTIGRKKVEVMKERILSIAPRTEVEIFDTFYLPERADEFDFSAYDYVVDAIDTVSGKLSIIERAKAANTPVISAMGAGNKLDPTAFKVADIYETSVCPLAKVMRRELKKRGVKKLKVVYSEEEPCIPDCLVETGKKPTPGSVAFVPSVVGLIMAGEVIKDLIK